MPVTRRPLIPGPAHRLLARPRGARRRRQRFQPIRLRRFAVEIKTQTGACTSICVCSNCLPFGTSPSRQEPRPGYPSRSIRWSLSRFASRLLSQSARCRSDKATLPHYFRDGNTQFWSYPPPNLAPGELSTRPYILWRIPASLSTGDPPPSTNFSPGAAFMSRMPAPFWIIANMSCRVPAAARSGVAGRRSEHLRRHLSASVPSWPWPGFGAASALSGSQRTAVYNTRMIALLGHNALRRHGEHIRGNMLRSGVVRHGLGDRGGPAGPEWVRARRECHGENGIRE